MIFATDLDLNRADMSVPRFIPSGRIRRNWSKMRTPRIYLGMFALALLLPLLLLACGGSDEPADGPSQEPTAAKEEGVFRIFEQEGVSWIFKETIPLFDTSLINRFPAVNWERVTYLLYWSLRISVFALLALLLIVSRIRKSRLSAIDYPQVPEGLTTLPSDLPAPAVSVLGSRKVGPKTYLSILVDMFQKGNLTITGGYGDSDKEKETPLPRLVYPAFRTRSAMGKGGLQRSAFLVCLRFSEAKLRYAEVKIRRAAKSHPHPSGRVPAVPGHF